MEPPFQPAFFVRALASSVSSDGDEEEGARAASSPL